MVVEGIPKGEDVSFYDRLISMPGALPMVLLVALIMPMTGIFPSIIGGMMLVVFTIPIIAGFLITVALNGEVSFRKHTLVLAVISYMIYMVYAWPFSMTQFYVLTVLFVFSAAFTGTLYVIYRTIYRIMRRWSLIRGSYRWLFVSVFVPSVAIGILAGFIISMLVGDMLFYLGGLL